MTDAAEIAAGAMARGAVQVESELRQFLEFLSMLRRDNVMEIGSEAGGTFWAWCRAFSGVKISVDLPTGASGSWNYASEEARERRQHMFQSWDDRAVVITGDSHEQSTKTLVKAALGKEKLDMLFLDGDHTYDGVREDYLTYLPLVRRGGLVAFHDIKDTPYHRSAGCRVDLFWNEVKEESARNGRSTWEFLDWKDQHGAQWGGIGAVEV